MDGSVARRDTLVGGAGGDYLNGGADPDTAIGGSGGDSCFNSDLTIGCP